MATQIKFGTSGWRAVMAEEFTFANVERAVHGIARYVSSQKSNREPALTPAISHAVIQSKADGAINFTASHNRRNTTALSSRRPMARRHSPKSRKRSSARSRPLIRIPKRPAQPKLSRNRNRLTRAACISPVCANRGSRRHHESPASRLPSIPCGALLAAIRRVPPRGGHTRGTVHDTRHVLFGGHAPEPDDHLLEDLRRKMREIDAAIGIATDGDADRF